MEQDIISPAMATMIFSLGTGALGGIATMVFANRVERTYGVDLWYLLLAVAVASALNIFFAAMLPTEEEAITPL